MSQLTATAIVRAPVSRVWDTISDVGTVKDWHPKVKHSPVLSAESTGVGATRRCEFYDGTSVVEQVTEAVEGRLLRVVLSEFSMPL